MFSTAKWTEYVRSWSGWGAIILAVSVAGAQASRAADSDVFRVEEDWELVVNDPDPSIHSPQISFFLMPNAVEPESYFQVQLNHAAGQEFSGGGFNVAAVQASREIDSVRSDTYQPLVTSDQFVRWTQVMAVSDSEAFFTIANGYCDDWGAFGGAASVVRMPAGFAANLNNYDPQRSVEMVDIGFGGNRISSLVLRNVRLYHVDGQVSEMSVNLSP